jgi:A/G-specific adenine glycosylase
MRHFIWRKNITPYRIMIAEFMLAKTKAEQVEPIYKNFIQEFPEIVSLSKASFVDVDKYTKRLGLFQRNNHFIKSAKYIMQNLKGIYPVTRMELLKIPGIGDYVAGAIMTVCYNKPEYVIDSNIARFINRFYGLLLNGEIRRKKELVKISANLFNLQEPGKFLFALLDFTAIVCKPRKPDCGNCVIRNDCCHFEYWLIADDFNY